MRQKKKEFSIVMANWLPTPPIRSLRPSVCMSFLFSLPWLRRPLKAPLKSCLGATKGPLRCHSTAT